MVFWDKEQVELEGLQSKLEKAIGDGTEITLVIQGDQHARHGKIVEVMDIANSAGVKKILITARGKRQ